MSDDAARTQGPDLLRQAMKEAGITQMALEAKLGASKGLTSRWLSGERVPELRFALALEDILGVPARAWLATDDDEFESLYVAIRADRRALREGR